jgi:hypothetical protein
MKQVPKKRSASIKRPYGHQEGREVARNPNFHMDSSTRISSFWFVLLVYWKSSYVSDIIENLQTISHQLQFHSGFMVAGVCSMAMESFWMS